MSYNISMIYADFTIFAADIEKAFEAVCKLGSGFRWVRVNTPWIPTPWKSFEQAMEAWRFPVEISPSTGDVVGITFDGENEGDEDELFSAIAPYVKKGSYIEMVGECGYKWRYIFTDGKMDVVPATTLYINKDEAVVILTDKECDVLRKTLLGCEINTLPNADIINRVITKLSSSISNHED